MDDRRTSPVLVGRSDELGALEAAFASREDHPILLVRGEAGAGKTRLAAAFAERVRAAGGRTVAGGCLELGSDVLPYAPFVEALTRLVEEPGAGAGGMVADDRTALAGLVPPLAGPAGIMQGDAGRGRVYEAVRATLDRSPEPLLLVLEDLHWADTSTLELLAYLARRLRGGRTAILCTCRTEGVGSSSELASVLAELTRSRRSVTVEVRSLGRADVGRMVRAIRGDDTPDDLVASIARRSGGNPFYVEELVAAGGDEADLPATLRELLLARIGDADAGTRQALALVAAAGRPVDQALVEGAWDPAGGPVEAALRDAVRRSILTVGAGDGAFDFRHALLGEAVRSELLPGERARLHAALARALEERPDLASPTAAGAAAELAHHLLAARDVPAALRATIRAADAASAVHAHAEARDLYERALDLWTRVPDAAGWAGRDLATLFDRAAETAFHAGDARRSVELGRAAVERAEKEGLPAPRIAHLLVRLIEWTEATGDFVSLEPLAERALALVPADPPSADRAWALLGLGASRLHATRLRELEAAAAEAAAVAAASGATAYEAIALSMRGLALAGLARDAEATADLDRALDLAKATDGTEEAVIVHGNRVFVYGYIGRIDRLGAAVAEARLALDRDGALGPSAPFLDRLEAHVLFADGRWGDAERLLTFARTAYPGTAPESSALIDALLGRLHVRQGRLDDGERDLRAALALREVTERETVVESLLGLAEAALSRGDPEAGRRFVGEGLAALGTSEDLISRTRVHAVGVRASVAAALRARARSRDDTGAVRDALGHADSLALALEGRLVVNGGVDDHVRAMAAWGRAELSRLDPEPAAGDWTAASGALLRIGESYLVTYCRYREAESQLVGGGDRARAEELLRSVVEWADRAGATPLADDARALARRARIDLAPAAGVAGPVPAGPSDPWGLSARELEVLALLVDGRTNREIGAELFITEKTASVHVSHIMDKLGVTSRGAAAALAARSGFTGVPPTGGPVPGLSGRDARPELA